RCCRTSERPEARPSPRHGTDRWAFPSRPSRSRPETTRRGTACRRPRGRRVARSAGGPDGWACAPSNPPCRSPEQPARVDPAWAQREAGSHRAPTRRAGPSPEGSQGDGEVREGIGASIVLGAPGRTPAASVLYARLISILRVALETALSIIRSEVGFEISSTSGINRHAFRLPERSCLHTLAPSLA